MELILENIHNNWQLIYGIPWNDPFQMILFQKMSFQLQPKEDAVLEHER